MRVAADELVDEGGGHVVDGERAPVLLVVPGGRCAVLGDTGVEDDLEQHVAEFFPQGVAVALLDGLDEFERLLHGVLGEPFVGLPGRPGALLADAVHDLDEVDEAGAGQVVGAGEEFQVGHGDAAGAA